MQYAAAAYHERESDQSSLFEATDIPRDAIPLSPVEDWPVMERLREEGGALGLYLSAHPIDAYSDHLQPLGVETAAEIRTRAVAGPVIMAGTLESKKERTSKKGNRYAFITLSDASGVFEVTVFSETLLAARDILTPGESLLVKAQAQVDEHKEVKFLADSFTPLETAAARIKENLYINVASGAAIAAIRELLADQQEGRTRIHIQVQPDSCAWRADIELAAGYWLSADARLTLGNISGVGDIETVAAK
jgi:DNA polymerase-3 subunit alpha